MSGALYPDRVELVNTYRDRYLCSAEEAEQIVGAALDAAKEEEGYIPFLFAWLFDLPCEDMLVGGISLLETAKALNGANWNLPAACLLMREEKTLPGIAACTGLYCEIEKELVCGDGVPERIVKTGKEIFRVDGGEDCAGYIVTEAWKAVLRFPGILSALLGEDPVGTEYRRFGESYYGWNGGGSD